MKKYLFSLCILFFSSIVYSQIAVGEWRAHLSYNDAILSEPGDNNVYVLCADMQKYDYTKDSTNVTSLFSYDIEDSSIHTYDKVNLLSDNDITFIKYSQIYKTLIIIYKNSNIDLLTDQKYSYNIPDYMNKIMMEDKYVNDIYLFNEYAYLSTNFGVVILNLKKKEITNSYVLNKKVYGTVVINNTIYLATNEGIYKGIQNDNLQDKSNWKLINNEVFNQLVYFENTIIGNNISSGIYKYDINTNSFSKIKDGKYSYIKIYDDKLIAGNNNDIIIYSNLNSYIIKSTENEIKHLSYHKKKNIYWGSNQNKGLNGYKYNQGSNTFENVISSTIPNSPRRNIFDFMTFVGDRLLVAGGSFNYTGIVSPGTLMIYENEKWDTFQEEGIEEQTGLTYDNLTSIIQDPNDPEHHFVSSPRHGLYEFKDRKFIKLHTIDNSEIEHISKIQNDKKNYVTIGALKYDKNHNLWMTNCGTNSIFKVLTNNGKWIKYSHPKIAGQENYTRMMIDSRGWIWSNSTWDNNNNQVSGFFCFNNNNTLENTNDDQTVYYKKIKNQDGTEISPGSFLSIAEDKKGTIWIGTDIGPLVINNPTKVFDDNFYCTQIKVPKNDGSNNADFLLANENITAITIDGANRKWIGTEKNGVFLISEDGLETIHHFTINNSPLLSNNIKSIAINPYNGEVFIGTEKGLVSYRSDATEAESSFSEKAHVFPNPVKPDYNGLITVTGLVMDSDVKITDSNGNLIHTGRSLGGQFSWNGRNRSGKRVASGIYFVLATDSDGKEGIVTKILMIK